VSKRQVVILGSFVADLAFRTKHLPAWGQTVLGSEFRLGPGGKGSNQAVAAARLGGDVSFISKLGRDAFGDLARKTYDEEGIDTQYLFETTEHATGGAAIIVDQVSGENAIVVLIGIPPVCRQDKHLRLRDGLQRIAHTTALKQACDTRYTCRRCAPAMR